MKHESKESSPPRLEEIDILNIGSSVITQKQGEAIKFSSILMMRTRFGGQPVGGKLCDPDCDGVKVSLTVGLKMKAAILRSRKSSLK